MASPNPMVGAVVATAAPESEPIGEGWHRRYGGLHAEREALADCREKGHDPAGATIFVSLEPCAHHGRQPPCVDAILEAGISRVVIAADDPSAKTAGVGPKQLRKAGVEVVFAAEAGADGIAERAELLNQPFRKHAQTGLPLVIYKAAISLDGRVATAGGDSKWISGPESRELVHRWRAELDAIAVGIETALADDPLLTARPENGPDLIRQPLRIVFDSRARLPVSSRLVETIDTAPLLVIFGPDAAAERVEELEAAGVQLHVTGLTHEGEPVPETEKVDLAAALSELGARGVSSLLLEGGSRLAGAMVEAGLVDEIRLFVAPLLLGAGPSVIENAGVANVDLATRAEALSAESIGDDILIRARLRRW